MFERNDYTAHKRHLRHPAKQKGQASEEACPTMANVKCDAATFCLSAMPVT